MPPRITDFVFDEENEAKLDWPGLAPEHLVQVLWSGGHFVARNRRARRASHIVIGLDQSGRCLAIPVEPTPDPSWWRPLTAWTCKRAERALLDRRP